MRNLLPAAVLLALIVGVGAIWLLSRNEAPTQPSQPAATPAAQTAAPAAVTAVTAPVDAQAPAPAKPAPVAAGAATERTPVAADEPAPPPEARSEHTLRGRAVDAAGQPIAGATATLFGSRPSSVRMIAWSLRHAEPQPIETKVMTGADGAFTFRFWPPPPFEFTLRLEGRGIAASSHRWVELAPGGTTDLGDVKLERGTLLRGRIVDADMQPVARVDLHIQGQQLPDQAKETSSSAQSGKDGTFTAQWALPAGKYRLEADDQVVDHPKTVELTGEPEQIVEVVLKRLAADDVISGIVVDETGAPVEQATIIGSWIGVGRPATTDAAGRFRVVKGPRAATTMDMHAFKSGYESQTGHKGVAWGRDDVRFELKRGKEFDVLVVRAADGQPVEDYVLRIAPVGISTQMDELLPRGTSPHSGGREFVTGIRVGAHDVIVEPRSEALATAVVPIEVGPGGTPPVTVRLAGADRRSVRVVTADGAPVVGVKVQLVDPLRLPFDERTRVWVLGGEVLSSGPQALELAAAVTDAQGKCTLRPPTDRPLGLLLPGPGHAPLALANVVFPADGPLVITVRRGAVLRGRIGPEAALARIAPAAGTKTTQPSVYLERTGQGTPREQFPGPRDRCLIEPDGSFELAGAGSGRWSVVVHWFDPSARGGTWRPEAAGTVDLVDDETTAKTFELSGVLEGALDALVLHNGAPLANASLDLNRTVDRGGADPSPVRLLVQRRTVKAETDAAGRVRVDVRPGEYRVVWKPKQGLGQLVADERAVVRVGETTQQTFTLVSGHMKVRLLDAAGAPAAKITLYHEGGEALGHTREDGRAEFHRKPGTFTTWVHPKKLQSPEALRDYMFSEAQKDRNAMEKIRVSLGTLTVRGGETTEIELRLPADW